MKNETFSFEEFRNERLGRYGEAFLEISRIHPDTDPAEQLSMLAETLFKSHFKEERKQLIELYAREELSQKDLDVFLEKTDIEAMNAEIVLIFAYLLKKFPDLDFGKCNIPRLKGVIKYYRFQNLERFSHLTKITKQLNDKNVIPMVIKGGAMKVLRPDLPRIMGDIDVVFLCDGQFELARQTVKEMGYVLQDASHSIDVRVKGQEEKGVVDIHRRLHFLNSGKFNAELFSRANLQNVCGVQCYVPSYEDLAFIIIMNISLNLSQESCSSGIPFSVIDLLYLSAKGGFDWSLVFEDVEKNELEGPFFLAFRFIENIVPGLIPSEFMKRKDFENKVRQYSINEKRYVQLRNSKALTRIVFYRRKIRSIPLISNSKFIMNCSNAAAGKIKRVVRAVLDK